MTLFEATLLRHSVRSYNDTKIESDKIKVINDFINKLNAESGLNIQFLVNEPKAFDCFLSRYGKFSGVKNYFAMVGKKSKSLQETIGYYGERLVLFCQTLGLNTCWVGLSYKKVKNTYSTNKNEKLSVVISVGYGKTQDVNRKSKTINQVAKINENTPKWFVDGVECALNAPTAINQQKFYFELKGDKVLAKAGKGFYSKMDLGIAKLHFELGSNRKIDWL